jgi:hypothetical protein
MIVEVSTRLRNYVKGIALKVQGVIKMCLPGGSRVMGNWFRCAKHCLFSHLHDTMSLHLSGFVRNSKLMKPSELLLVFVWSLSNNTPKSFNNTIEFVDFAAGEIDLKGYIVSWAKKDGDGEQPDAAAEEESEEEEEESEEEAEFDENRPPPTQTGEESA